MLERKLDKNHDKVNRVAPAFQWAQNSSAIFLQVKYASRWNAPGSIDVRDLNITFTPTGMHMSAFGDHSGITKEYALDLELLDYVDVDRSEWSKASVGKMTMTLAKKYWGKAWPRLLAEKKKIQNMGVWSAMQDKQKESPPAQNSALLCHKKQHLYCVKNDRCVPQCTGCEDTSEQGPRCVGKPSMPSIADGLKDTSGERGKASVSFEVTLSDESQADEIVGFLTHHNLQGDAEAQLDLPAEEQPELLFQVSTTGQEKYSVRLPNIAMVNETSHIAIFARNKVKRGKPLIKPLTDAAVPTQAPAVAFEWFSPTTAKEQWVSGNLTVTPAETNETVDSYTVYAGKNANTRSNRKVLETVKTKGQGVEITQNVTAKVGSATHLLVFAKNSHGEALRHAAVAIPPRPPSPPEGWSASGIADGMMKAVENIIGDGEAKPEAKPEM